MPWSHYLQNKFAKYSASASRRGSGGSETSSSTTSSSSFAPPASPRALEELFHAILLECFCEDRYDVVPRYDLSQIRSQESNSPGAGSRSTQRWTPEKRMIDFVVEAFDGSPVLFVDVCKGADRALRREPRQPLPSSSAIREPQPDEEFDEQWRTLSSTFTQLAQASRLQRMYGISAVGNDIVCYMFDRGAGGGGRICLLDSKNGQPRPDCATRVDVMSDEGYERMMQIVDEVEWMVQELK